MFRRAYLRSSPLRRVVLPRVRRLPAPLRPRASPACALPRPSRAPLRPLSSSAPAPPAPLSSIAALQEAVGAADDAGAVLVIECFDASCSPSSSFSLSVASSASSSRSASSLRLARLDVASLPDAARALHVSRTPSVIAIRAGRVVGGFVGERTREDLDAFFDSVASPAPAAAQGSEEGDPDALLQDGREAFSRGELAASEAAFKAVLAREEWTAHWPSAYAGLAQGLVASGRLDKAKAMVDVITAGYQDALDEPDVVRAVAAVAVASEADGVSSLDELEARLRRDPNDLQACYASAVALLANGQHDEAVNAALRVVARDREWEDGRARTLLERIFDLLGEAHPTVQRGRRRLTNILLV